RHWEQLRSWPVTLFVNSANAKRFAPDSRNPLPVCCSDGNHRSLCDSWPLAISGRPRGTLVFIVTSRQNAFVETLPRPGMRLALRLPPRRLLEQDKDPPGSIVTQAVAKHFFASYSSLRCQMTRAAAASLRATETRANSGRAPPATRG